jgi:hypothetical protein
MSDSTPPTPSTEDIPLFAGYAPPERLDTEGLSAGQRLTLRQASDISIGRHPLTGGALHPLASRHRDADSTKSDPFTCGSCYFRRVEQYHDRAYPKCWRPNPNVGADAPMRAIYSRVTHGAGSDVRAWWPACTDYTPGDRISPDAARSIPGDLA